MKEFTVIISHFFNSRTLIGKIFMKIRLVLMLVNGAFKDTMIANNTLQINFIKMVMVRLFSLIGEVIAF